MNPHIRKSRHCQRQLLPDCCTSKLGLLRWVEPGSMRALKDELRHSSEEPLESAPSFPGVLKDRDDVVVGVNGALWTPHPWLPELIRLCFRDFLRCWHPMLKSSSACRFDHIYLILPAALALNQKGLSCRKDQESLKGQERLIISQIRVPPWRLARCPPASHETDLVCVCRNGLLAYEWSLWVRE